MFKGSLGCGNKVRSLTGPEAEGKVNCTKLQYGLTMVETRKNESSIQGSETLFEGEGCYDNLFQHRIIDEDNVWGFNYNQLFFTEQSRKILDTMLPKTQTKCSSANWNFCRYEPKQIDNDLEIKIEEIELSKIKDLEICRIPFSTLVTDRSIFTKRLNTLIFPCTVEKQVTCCHAMIEINNNIDEEITVDFDEKHILEVKEQRYEEMKTGSDQIVSQWHNVSNMGSHKFEQYDQFSRYQIRSEKVSKTNVPTDEILPQHLPRPPGEILPHHLPRPPEDILPQHQPRPPEDILLEELPRPPEQISLKFLEQACNSKLRYFGFW